METELKSSIELEQMRTSAQNALKEQIEAKSALELQANDLKRKKLELKAEIAQIDIELSAYTQALAKARNNIRRHELDIDNLKTAFFAARRDNR